MDFLIDELTNLYSSYEKTCSVNTRLEIILEIEKLEKKVLEIKDNTFITDTIINHIFSFSNFITTRYIYILSNINVEEGKKEEVGKLFCEIINLYLLKKETNPLARNAILGIGNLKYFSSKDFLLKKLLLKNSEDYINEFIVTLSKFPPDKEILDLFISYLSKYYNKKALLFKSIGKLSDYKNFPMLKRKHLNDFIKYSIKFLKRKKYTNYELENLLFAISKIAIYDSGLDGKSLNILSDLIYGIKANNIFKEIAIKIINNNLLNDKEILLLNNY